MNIISWLIRDTSKKQNHSHIRNLIEIALADGRMDEEEMVLLINLAQKLGITREEITQIKQNPSSVVFHTPKNSKQRFDQIYDLVCMMMVNGEINKNELKLCKDLALKLGYLPRIVDDFILMITQNVSSGVSSAESYLKMKDMVN
jgi:uncharacterized membrane protein YebE (DUF533 family)